MDSIAESWAIVVNFYKALELTVVVAYLAHTKEALVSLANNIKYICTCKIFKIFHKFDIMTQDTITLYRRNIKHSEFDSNKPWYSPTWNHRPQDQIKITAC